MALKHIISIINVSIQFLAGKICISANLKELNARPLDIPNLYKELCAYVYHASLLLFSYKYLGAFFLLYHSIAPLFSFLSNL